MATITARIARRWGLLIVGVAFVAGACSAYGTGGAAAPGGSAPVVVGATSAPSAPAAPASQAVDDYGRGGYGQGGGAAASPSAPGAGAESYEVAIASGAVGKYLTGEDGRTLYIFKKDSPNTSVCAGDCATNWPPFTIDAGEALKAGDGVGGKLTTFARADGTMQVAYNGAPLYYFAADKASGDTNGQGINNVWFVAAP